MLSGATLAVAIAAINRPVATGLEGYFGLSATLSADDRIHLARGSVATHPTLTGALSLPSSATIGAALGFILETAGRVEFLFSGSKRELLSTISTLESFVLKSHWMTSFLRTWLEFWPSKYFEEQEMQVH